MAGQANRYKLIYHYYSGNKKIFGLDFEDGTHRDKFALTELDAFTSNFSNEEELTKALSLIFSGYENGYFTIEYNSGGHLNSLELVFNDMTFIRKLATENLRETVVPKSSITIYMNKFLNKIDKDPEFLNFIFSHRYTNRYFRDALSYYLMLKNSDEKDAQSSLWEAKANLVREFKRYKTIRGLEVGRHNYELLKQNKKIARNPSELTELERAEIEYNLNHPKKVKKRSRPKKTDVIDGQLPLFDPELYTEKTTIEHKRTKK